MYLITLNPGLISLFEIQFFSDVFEFETEMSLVNSFIVVVILCRKTAKPNDSSLFYYELIYTYCMLLI